MSSYLLSQEQQEVLVVKLKDLLHYASENFSYYKNEGIHLYSDSIHSLLDIRKIPILERNNLLHSDLINEVISKNPPAYFETSGTTGNPFPVIPNLSQEKNNAFASFMDSWMSLTQDNVTKAIIALPFEMNPVGLKYYLGLTTLGITSIPAGVRTHLCTPSKVLQIIARLKPELLIGRPLEILRYAEAMGLENTDSTKTSIKKIIFTGEIVSKNKWKRMSRYYGNADVRGIYGLTEVDSGGLISCKKHQYKYHLPTFPYLIVEVLKDDLMTPVSDGEEGNVIFTNTEKNYLPLIRYNSGDIGRLHATCDCELNTPSIEILGRKSDYIQSQTGKVFPIQIENILFQYDEVGSDYQILSQNGKITLRIEINKKHKEERDHFSEQIKCEIHKKLNLPVYIDAYAFGQLTNKLGIAKDKAGKLYVLDNYNENEIQEKLRINFC
ncbi:MAG: hypothetical protein A3F11_03855 [Gammaproteobacteria bacterium RIFCSPHIGHO2_12_FULL_37_14]|nr:MAG: hypothetical protein A3F11_03855 [Gammaproteobacteria bacterium RIFCSPHIGHO2_12_FULL_37_14]